MGRRLFPIVVLLGLFADARQRATASELLHNAYDEGKPTLVLGGDPQTFQILDHQRQTGEKHAGAGAEHLRGTANANGGYVHFVQPLPPAAAIDDVSATLWVRASRPAVQLHLRLVFPESRDPESGRPVTALIAGEQYEQAGHWMQLKCGVPAEAVQDAVRRARYRFPNQKIGETNLYIDAVVLSAAFGPQPTPFELFVDDLHYGPIVTPANVVAPPEPKTETIAIKPAVEFRLNRLEVEGAPFFPIITPFFAGADENLDLFAGTAVNVAWIPNFRDGELINRLREAGLWITAEPPRIRDEAGELLDRGEAGIVPFGPETRPIIFWNFSTRHPVDSLDQLIDWVNQIHAADTQFDRPSLADVTGAAYAFSNHIDLLAISRHITNTSISYDHYRDWLINRRADAFVNTFFWTWIQTEPAEQASLARAAAGQRPIVIEPAQIRLQVYAALQAGCRGIGYWRTIPFGVDGVGMDERRLTLTRLNLELDILEPLLATAGAPGTPTRFGVAGQRPGSEGTRVRQDYNPVTLTGPEAGLTPFAAPDGSAGSADAVMMRTEFGPLMIAVWFGEGSQFCPGRLARNDVKIIVPGVEETASAWLITPTEIRLLPDSRVAGGKEITLDKFDQTAVVLFTSDVNTINRFRSVIARHAPRVAAVSVELARHKRERVAATHRRLSAVAPPLPDGAAILARADQLLAQAQSALARGDYHAARLAADDTLQALRILQHAHWSDAVRPLESPLTSPHTVSFSTLPDHYELIAKVGRSLMAPSYDANILPSGSFEDNDQALEDGWEHIADTAEGISAGADLVATSPHSGKYALELYATRQPEYKNRLDAEAAFVTFQSPAIPVEAGTVLHISGWVNVIEPVAPERDGATLHDNLMGLSAGLRWTKTDGWERFELLREVPRDGDFRLTLALHGEGRVQFDDLLIIPHVPHTTIATQPAADKE